MENRKLYNDKQFPDYIFTDKVTSYLFFEFDYVFEQEFWQLFKNYLVARGIKKILIENILPKFSFNEEIDVEELPKAFNDLVRSENIEGYFSFGASFYLITERALIYPKENDEFFCIVLDRDYSLCIIGFVDLKSSELDKKFMIEDVADYLLQSFGGRNLPDKFKSELYRNWKLT